MSASRAIDVPFQIGDVEKPSGRYSHLRGVPGALSDNNLWRWAYDTGDVLGLDNETQLFAWEGKMENFMKGPFIVLPQPASYYRDNEFFQNYVIAERFGPDLVNDIHEYAHHEWVNKLRCYVALEDFNGIEYTDKRALLLKLRQEVRHGNAMFCVFYYVEDDPQNRAELIIIDPTEVPVY